MSIFYIPEYDCVFNHIPKTAGRSIRFGFFEKHLNTRLKGGYVRWPSQYMLKWSFAFTRNPYDRFFSAYNFTQDILKHKYTLKEFIDIATDETIPYLSSSRDDPLGYIRHHTFPQTHIDHYLSNTKFIGRYENLDNDFESVCNQLNIKYSLLPKYNVSSKPEPEKEIIVKKSIVQSVYDIFFRKKQKEVDSDKKEKKIDYDDYYCDLFGKEILSVINDYWEQDFTQLNYKMAQVKT